MKKTMNYKYFNNLCSHMLTPNYPDKLNENIPKSLYLKIIKHGTPRAAIIWF